MKSKAVSVYKTFVSIYVGIIDIYTDIINALVRPSTTVKSIKVKTNPAYAAKVFILGMGGLLFITLIPSFLLYLPDVTNAIVIIILGGISFSVYCIFLITINFFVVSMSLWLLRCKVNLGYLFVLLLLTSVGAMLTWPFIALASHITWLSGAWWVYPDPILLYVFTPFVILFVYMCVYLYKLTKRWVPSILAPLAAVFVNSIPMFFLMILVAFIMYF
ncbi:MAG: hypothetical protein PHG85_07395 [Candidatus Altiarchaeota archaeon]|nr:hypothetical protein [Candidatus Altiarchaeota archaeon]